VTSEERIAELEARNAALERLVESLGDKLLTVSIHLSRLAEKKGLDEKIAACKNVVGPRDVTLPSQPLHSGL
jgi:uncharacterized coiled-coil protein SlyX